ncbi:carboxypeptidase M32 [Risungbinella massiliensis]|uniref:carboxypeptidase M32 n=1 Tax=Risungbinella massiliensis TaxID=1329796 RepID=UPI0005CBEB5A|nr:carboxypeptidase M32 [Risungbinella massiliensis]
MEAFHQLLQYYRELSHLKSVYGLLIWDQNTKMPIQQTKDRGEQIGVLYELLHQKMTSKELCTLLDRSSQEIVDLPKESYEVRLVKRAVRDYERANQVPAPFMAEIAQHATETYQAWLEAKSLNNFNKVKGHLERMIDYSREYTEFFQDREHVLDPLIDLAESGLKVSYVQKIFQDLRAKLVPLVRRITSQEVAPYPTLPSVPKEDQLRYTEWLVQKFGFSFEKGRQDLSPHPFMIRLGADDIRITTRVEEADFTESIFSSIHETGHALYELGLSREYIGTPFDEMSTSVHESQSRLYENIVGRSRAFWSYAYPELQRQLPQTKGLEMEDFYRIMNRVEPSLIRTKADEVTYNLHIMIRFETEMELLTGKLKVDDLPDYWNAAYQSTMGVQATSLAEGVLQDSHWFSGMVGGCFQGYALGNLISCQILEKIERSYPKLWEDVADGTLVPLRSWLQENIHRHGSYYDTPELLEKVTGKELSVDPFIRYLERKYGDLYPGL